MTWWGRTWRWLGWGLALGLLPLVFSVFGKRYHLHEWPSARDVIGEGQALLVVVAWFSAAIRELRDTPPSRSGAREAITVTSVLFLLGTAFGYGLVTGDQPDADQQGLITSLSVGLLITAAVITVSAVIIGTAATDQSEV